MSEPLILFVGEVNPFRPSPGLDLYDEPDYASGARLRRLVLGIPRRTYLGPLVGRRNLCRGAWSMAQAKTAAAGVLEEFPTAVVVTLGAKVSAAFAKATMTPAPALFESRGRMVRLPHPSGLCREWHTPGAFDRARRVLANTCPGIRWGMDLEET